MAWSRGRAQVLMGSQLSFSNYFLNNWIGSSADFAVVQEENRCVNFFVGGVMTLVFKNKGSRVELKNYRPISLLNAVYKILARVLGARLQTVMHIIVGPNQTYSSVPGRDIADSILSIIWNAYAKMMNDGGIFLSLGKITLLKINILLCYMPP